MTHANAIRFLAYHWQLCRDRDMREMCGLNIPAMMKVYDLEPMEDVEAAAFRHEFLQRLRDLPYQDAADRQAQAHPAAVTLRKAPAQDGLRIEPAYSGP